MTLDDFFKFFSREVISVYVEYNEPEDNYEIKVLGLAQVEDLYFKKMAATPESLDYFIETWKLQVYGDIENYNEFVKKCQGLPNNFKPRG